MKKLCLLLILGMVPMLALAQSDSLTTSTDQNETQIQVANGCVTLLPNSRDFGPQPVDFPTAAKPFFLLNTCAVNLHVTNITAQGSAFTQTNHIGGTQAPCNTGAPLTPGEYCEIDVVFDPHSAGSFSNNLVIMYTKDGNPQVMQISAALSGTGIHDLTFNPTSCDFGGVPVDHEAFCTVMLTNQEPQSLTLNNCHVAPRPPFSEDTSCPASLGAGDSVNIMLDFDPPQPGAYSGQFIVTTDSPEEHDSGNPYTAPLTGVGIIICPRCPPPQ